MRTKDTLLSPEQFRSIEEQAHKSSWEKGNELFPEELIAEISFKLGKQEGRKEVVEWLQEYAIHGGEIPLKSVLEDIETHSSFMMKDR